MGRTPDMAEWTQNGVVLVSGWRVCPHHTRSLMVNLSLFTHIFMAISSDHASFLPFRLHFDILPICLFFSHYFYCDFQHRDNLYLSGLHISPISLMFMYSSIGREMFTYPKLTLNSR